MGGTGSHCSDASQGLVSCKAEKSISMGWAFNWRKVAINSSRKIFLMTGRLKIIPTR
jgi:hypothetical protein